MAFLLFCNNMLFGEYAALTFLCWLQRSLAHLLYHIGYIKDVLSLCMKTPFFNCTAINLQLKSEILNFDVIWCWLIPPSDWSTIYHFHNLTITFLPEALSCYCVSFSFPFYSKPNNCEWVSFYEMSNRSKMMVYVLLCNFYVYKHIYKSYFNMETK